LDEESPGAPPRARTGIASLLAALAFAYTLIVTVALLFVEGFFSDQGNQRTVLIWLTLPILASFLGWMAVSSPNSYLRVGVWFLVLAVLFFCWLSIFSIGLYYLPAPFLMVVSVLGPWDGQHDDTHN